MKMSASIVLYKHDPSEIDDLVREICITPCISQLFLIDNYTKGNIDYSDLLNNKTYLYKSKENLGYGAGHNIAINKSDKSNIAHAIVNPDISLNSGSLFELLKRLFNEQDVGMITPLIKLETGSIQYSCKYSPRPMDLIVRLLPSNLFTKRKNYFEMRELNYNQEIYAPYISGCFMIVKLEVIKQIGGFDENFFMYPEDIDLSRRIAEKYKILHYPKVEIVHGWQRASRKSFSMLWTHIINICKYFNKWGWFYDPNCDVLNKKYFDYNITKIDNEKK